MPIFIGALSILSYKFAHKTFVLELPTHDSSVEISSNLIIGKVRRETEPLRLGWLPKDAT